MDGIGIFFREPFDDLPGFVGGAVVDVDDFMGEAVFLHDAVDPSLEFGEGFGLVEQGDHH